MTVTFHARPVARSSAPLMAVPFVEIISACCDGVKARTIGLSNDPRRGPVVGLYVVPAVPPPPPHAATIRPAANAHPNGPRRVLRMIPLLARGSVPIICG